MSDLLLITGSQQSTPAALAFVERVLDRVKERDWQIIVGDARGVDAAVVAGCIARDIEFSCYGITPKARCPGGDRRYTRVPGDFLARDRFMVEAADRVLAIWNGYSGGTKYAYNYAIQMGKPADIRVFGKETA